MRPSNPVSGFRPAGLAVALLMLVTVAPCAALAQSAGVVFAGFDHQALGAATLDVDPVSSRLFVGNLNFDSGGYSYQLDAEGGSIRFGDGITGQRPPTGSWKVHGQYRYGGGDSGSISGVADPSDLHLGFDLSRLTTNLVWGSFSQQGQMVVEGEFSPLVDLIVLEWPELVSLSIEDGEMVTLARWDTPIPILLPDQQQLTCDEVVFRSQTGGALSGEELGQMLWEGVDLGQVQMLGERFREGGDWYEVTGNLRLDRLPEGHELTHVVQQEAQGDYVEFPPSPCLDLMQPSARQTNGLTVEGLALPAQPELGTRMESLQFMDLPNQSLARIPTHAKEWTDYNEGDPGMTLLGLFEELGASSYTVQVFDRGLLVDSESGLGSAVARTKEYVVQHDQTDMDFLHQRACAQVDLGREVEVTILAPTPRAVLGDRIHIIPEGLQVFPDCVEAVGVRLTKVGDITLKRGVVGVALPPALVFGLSNQAGGDALLKLVNGQLVVANEAWGPGASGPLSGGVRTPVAGLEGFRWQLAGNLDPQQLPPESKRSFRLVVQDANGQLGTAGLDVELQNGSFAIGADYSALGSSDAQLDAYLGPQRVYTGVLHQQGRVLVDADFNEVEYLEDETGNVSFILGWESARTLIIEGQPVVATRLSTRSGHRDRAVTASDFECLLQDTPYAEVHRASVRPHRGWLSAVGEVAFGDFTEMPLLLTHLNPLSATGVEAEAEKDPQGTAYVQLAVEDPELRNTLDGDERVSLLIQEESDAAAKSGLAATKTVYAPGSVVFERLGGAWRVQVDFAAAGYGGFRVMGDGLGELYLSSTPSGEALICDAWPSSMIVEGVDGELWIRLVFDSPATISTPGSRTLSSSGITLAVTGGTHPPFETGQVQFLCEGLPITALGDAQIAVGVPEDHREVPRSTRSVVLRPAVPNPFNPRTLLRYELAQAGEVSLAIYDTAGRRIRTLVEGPRPAGEGTALWDGRDERGQAVASGNYLVQLRGPTGSAQEKIVLVR